MNRRGFLSSVASLLAPRERRPNIVLILADDLGYGDLGCYGQSRILTPHIDRLAAEGARYTAAYAGAPVCAPSRCCLMTGLHTGHARIRANMSADRRRVSLQAEDRTVASLLKQAGYRTAAIGKWGIGEAGSAGTPNDQGFDEWFGFLNQDHALDYYPTHLWRNRTEFFPKGNQGGLQSEYAQDLFAGAAVEFIQANRSAPFFLYLAFTVPHASSELGRRTGDGFVVPDYGAYAARPWPRPEQGFAAMVSMLDRDVGRVREALRKSGIDDNTVIIFTSDNGPARDGGHDPTFFGSAGAFRGRKSELYEGGIRVPFIVRGPGVAAPGAVVDAPIAFWDFLPTAAHWAGAKTPECDGVSILPSLQSGARIRERTFYWESPAKGLHQAVRTGPWKGVHRPGGPWELYNLDDDPAESRDLASQRPDVLKRLEAIRLSSHTPSTDYAGLEPVRPRQN